jgi:hypothetical protein
MGDLPGICEVMVTDIERGGPVCLNNDFDHTE